MSASTAFMLPALGFATPIEEKDSPVETLKLTLDVPLQNNLNLLNQRLAKLKQSKLMIYNGETSIEALNKTYRELSELNKSKALALSLEEKLAIEDYKLAIMRAIQADLFLKYGRKEKEVEISPPKAAWRYIVFGLLLVLNLIPMAVGNFVGVNNFLSSVPGCTQAMSYLVSSLVCLIEAFSSYSFLGPLLKNTLGIRGEETPSELLVKLNDKCSVTKSINKMLTNEVDYTDRMSVSRFRAYANIAKHFNNDLEGAKIEEFKEPFYKKAIRFGLTVLNLSLNVSGGYFMANSLLALVASSLIGTPIGWGIVGLIVLGGLVGRFAIRSNSTFNLLNPSAKKYKEIQKRLTAFENKNERIERILSKKESQHALVKENITMKIQSEPTNLEGVTTYPSVSPHDVRVLARRAHLPPSDELPTLRRSFSF